MPFSILGALRAAAMLFLVASFSFAQHPERPRLPRGADPNDWEAYYDMGIERLRKDDGSAAEAAFYWSSRLRPDRADPLYGRWLAFWARDIKTFGDYLREDSRVLRDPRVLRVDSLRFAALRRNPFIHQGMVIYLYNRLPGNWQQDQLTMGWIALGQAQLPLALERFGRLVKSDEKKYGHLRFTRASAFANIQRLDSAAAELTTLLAQLRAEDDKAVGAAYQSKELLELALGLLHLQVRRTAAAKEAFGRAITENAGFAPAHMWMGRMAVAARDTANALLESSLAVETDPSDVEARISYGDALILARRPKDAVLQYLKAAELEPFYADPRFRLATATEAAGDAAAAKEHFARFLELASRSDPRRVEAERKSK
jgi:tetratricopeptide (TPR) repeat protein